jgi:glucokinase
MAKKQVVVGVDLGGTNTVFGIVDRDGNILAEDSIKTTHYDEIEVFVAALYEKIMVTRQEVTEGIEIIGFA